MSSIPRPLTDAPSNFRSHRILNFIGGSFAPPVRDEYLDNYCPATGLPYCVIANSTNEDVDKAVDAAALAFPSWSALSTEVRADYLMKIAAGIAARIDEFAAAESYDQGKPLWLARSVDIPRAIENFRFFAGRILHHEDAFTHFDRAGAESFNMTLREPFGAVGLISPWNLPLYLLSWKIAPAIACGNTCVAKPSELTPLTATLLAEVIQNVALPPGVVNIVHGEGARCGQRIVEHPLLRLLSFTGGTVTGRRVASTAAPMFKKVSLELGGKNATIVFSDCDFDATVQGVVRASFANQGEVCLCGSRILVERDIYDRFVAAVAKAAAANGRFSSDPRSAVDAAHCPTGALISRQHLEKIRGYVALAREEGGHILCGGASPEIDAPHLRSGYFYPPTIISGLPPAARCNQEEIFGPVVTIAPFDSETEAIHVANGVPYGLSCSIWTSNIFRGNRVARKVHVGYVWLNCWLVRDLRMPFGGQKASGLGREGGSHSLDFYTDLKTICSKL